MPQAVPLHSLLPERLDFLADQVKSRLCEDKRVGGMKLAWGFIGRELRGALCSVLDGDLLELMAKGWAEAEPLVEIVSASARAPGERMLVALAKHDISRDLRPVVAVTIGDCPCVELDFTFAISAHVGAVRLAVMDGHICGGDLGEVSASGQLSLGEIPLHPPAESRKVALPAEFRLEPPGIPIASLNGRDRVAG